MGFRFPGSPKSKAHQKGIDQLVRNHGTKIVKPVPPVLLDGSVNVFVIEAVPPPVVPRGHDLSELREADVRPLGGRVVLEPVPDAGLEEIPLLLGDVDQTEGVHLGTEVLDPPLRYVVNAGPGVSFGGRVGPHGASLMVIPCLETQESISTTARRTASLVRPRIKRSSE